MFGSFLFRGLGHTSGQEPRVVALGETPFDFGDVWQTPRLERVVTLRNPTSESLWISGFDRSCSCTSVEPSSLAIPARGEAAVRLVIDLRKAVGEDGRFDLRVTPSSDDPTLTFGPLTFVGTARRHPLSASPPELFFEGHGPSIEEPIEGQSTRVTSDVPLRSLDVQCDPADKGAAWVARDDEAGRRWSLFVVPADELPPGRGVLAMSLTGTAETGEVYPVIQIPAFVHILPRVAASPASVTFGARPVGGAATETVTLRSRDGVAFTIESVETDDPSLSVAAPRAVNPQPVHRIEVTQGVVERGPNTHRVRLRLSFKNEDEPSPLDLITNHYVLASPR